MNCPVICTTAFIIPDCFALNHDIHTHLALMGVGERRERERGGKGRERERGGGEKEERERGGRRRKKGGGGKSCHEG